MILVEHLTKYYGDVAAVKDLSFQVQEGHVYGFLGPNGAGKSTTMNIITGCLSATEGRVEVGGYDIFEHPREAKRLIGYLPEQPPLYLHETPLEYLSFVGEAKGLRGPALRDQVDRAVERAGLGGVLRRPVAALSLFDRFNAFVSGVFDLTASGTGEDRVYRRDGEDFDGYDLESALTGLTAASFTDEEPSGKEEIALTLSLDNENVSEMTIQLYRKDGETCLAVVDGVSVALVPRSSVVDLIEAVNAMVL